MDQQVKKIHNAVFVSDRIITYKVAAAILEVEVDEAKKVLEKYVKFQKDQDAIINVSYILGGLTKNELHKVKLVSELKYVKAKSTFKTINIDHIYSIQKAPLTDWSCIANVDDFLYDKEDTPKEIKPEHVSVKVKKEEKSPQNNNKNALFSFLNNTNKQVKVGAALKTVEKSKKQEKNSAFTNFFSKENNKENVKNEIKKESDDEDEELFKVNKKRIRVLNDDDDDDQPSKCAKVDILDDPEEYHSDEDLFGSPEKDEELMKDTETETTTTEMETETTKMESSAPETTEMESSAPETSEEQSETMYEDDDGYFVTEKKKPGPKQKNNVQKQKQLSQKEAETKKKTEKEETKTKKEINQKIKINTNQKTLLSFFQKK